MQDRRRGGREKVISGGIAEINARSSTVDGLVRDRGARVEIDETALVPQEARLNGPRKGRSFLADMIWHHTGRVRLAFRAMVTDPHSSDLDERVRRSQIKQRQLKRRIEDLLGQG